MLWQGCDPKAGCRKETLLGRGGGRGLKGKSAPMFLRRQLCNSTQGNPLTVLPRPSDYCVTWAARELHRGQARGLATSSSPQCGGRARRRPGQLQLEEPSVGAEHRATAGEQTASPAAQQPGELGKEPREPEPAANRVDEGLFGPGHVCPAPSSHADLPLQAGPGRRAQTDRHRHGAAAKMRGVALPYNLP